MSQIAVASIGDSDSLKVGEQVVAIGNALGYGQSVTTGIVSATNRTTVSYTHLMTVSGKTRILKAGTLRSVTGCVPFMPASLCILQAYWDI